MLKKAQQWVGGRRLRTLFQWSAGRSVFFCTIGLSSVFWLVRMSDWIDMTECQAAQSLPSVKGVQQ
jgi:hypothetical protein